MANADDIKQMMKAVVVKEQAKDRRLQPGKVREILLNWLAELKIPTGAKSDSWADLIQEFPVIDDDDKRDSGMAIMFAVRLATHHNRYLITILRCLSRDHLDIGTIAAHVNWRPTEKRLQAAVETTYTGDFEDTLRAKHILWIQSFKQHELRDALFHCAASILAHELTPAPDEPLEMESVSWPPPTVLNIPEPLDEDV